MSDAAQTLDDFYGRIEQHCLQMFAESLVYANQLGRNKWGVTLYPRVRVRLNVGSLVVCSLHPVRIWFALDGDYEETAAYEFLNRSEDWKWTPHYDYRVVSSISGYYTPSSAQKHAETWRHIKPMHFSLIDSVAAKYSKLRGPCRDSHSDAFLDELRLRLHRPDLPSPAYS